MMQTVKIFKNGVNQAIRIPKELAYEGITELQIQRVGDKLILEPLSPSWLTLYDDVSPLADDDDFLAERPDLFAMDDRVQFE